VKTLYGATATLLLVATVLKGQAIASIDEAARLPAQNSGRVQNFDADRAVRSKTDVDLEVLKMQADKLQKDFNSHTEQEKIWLQRIEEKTQAQINSQFQWFALVVTIVLAFSAIKWVSQRRAGRMRRSAESQNNTRSGSPSHDMYQSLVGIYTLLATLVDRMHENDAKKEALLLERYLEMARLQVSYGSFEELVAGANTLASLGNPVEDARRIELVLDGRPIDSQTQENLLRVLTQLTERATRQTKLSRGEGECGRDSSAPKERNSLPDIPLPTQRSRPDTKERSRPDASSRPLGTAKERSRPDASSRPFGTAKERSRPDASSRPLGTAKERSRPDASSRPFGSDKLRTQSDQVSRSVENSNERSRSHVAELRLEDPRAKSRPNTSSRPIESAREQRQTDVPNKPPDALDPVERTKCWRASRSAQI
jgi:hypothetical protein